MSQRSDEASVPSRRPQHDRVVVEILVDLPTEPEHVSERHALNPNRHAHRQHITYPLSDLLLNRMLLSLAERRILIVSASSCAEM